MTTTKSRARRILAALASAAIFLPLFGGGAAQATHYRLPTQLAWPPKAWMDHSPGSNVDTRYDSAIIPSNSIYYYPGHRGTDFGAPYGTPVYAAAAGRVIYVTPPGLCPPNGGNMNDSDPRGGGCGDGLGNYIALQHADGMVSIYGHLSAVNVTVGSTTIPCGAQIGVSGNSGRTSGAHLHFELRQGSAAKGATSYDPFMGYWYQTYLIPDPLYGNFVQVTYYPATTCSPSP